MTTEQLAAEARSRTLSAYREQMAGHSTTRRLVRFTAFVGVGLFVFYAIAFIVT